LAPLDCFPGLFFAGSIALDEFSSLIIVSRMDVSFELFISIKTLM
jgi:hypothetical protein